MILKENNRMNTQARRKNSDKGQVVLSGKYRKLEKIGRGTYGQVYKALDLDNDKFVAIKKITFHV